MDTFEETTILYGIWLLMGDVWDGWRGKTSSPTSKKNTNLSQKRFKNELNRLAKEGIVTREHNSMGWVRNILLIKKNDILRICIDQVPLNKAIKHPYFQFTTIKDILPEIEKAKVV